MSRMIAPSKEPEVKAKNAKTGSGMAAEISGRGMAWQKPHRNTDQSVSSSKAGSLRYEVSGALQMEYSPRLSSGIDFARLFALWPLAEPGHIKQRRDGG